MGVESRRIVRTVLLVHLFDYKNKLAGLNEVVVDLIPLCCSSDLWTRESGEWVEPQT
jgi:hypothetical protein